MLDNSFNELISMIEKRRMNAYLKINEEEIMLNFEVGEFIDKLIKNANYGDKVVDSISNHMKEKYPHMTGYDRRSLYRKVDFYNAYKNNEKALELAIKTSWSNNILILGNTKTEDERLFYLSLAVKEKYTKRELDRQIDSNYYGRYISSPDLALPSLTPTIDEDDYPNTRILDIYSLEFLDLPNQYKEKDFKDAILANMKDFILEIGKDFTFIREEYKVHVGKQDFYIDLLFYNRTLSCLVAFELKVGPYKAEYASKMSLYLEALDREVKKDHENPSVGVILCTSKDKDVVEYSMSKSMSQTLVSEYTLKLIDKKLLENKLKEVKRIIEISEQLF